MAAEASAEQPSRTGGVSDVGALYGALAAKLEQIVRLDVRAPDPVIEDACQFAWSRLVCHAERVQREAALSWLARTAVHEAFKLIGRDRRETSLEAMLDSGGESVFARPGPAPEEVVEWRARLGLIGLLPERQQRLIWLQAFGLSYSEMASRTGYSPRTVERQLLRAKRRLCAA